MQRHARQAKLVEVGAAGQARIAQAHVAVRHEGLAGEVTTRYLAGAGVGRLGVPNERMASLARAIDPSVRVTLEPIAGGGLAEEGDDLRDPTARAVFLGARAAVRSLRSVLAGSDA
jgi:hypothetical protein